MVYLLAKFVVYSYVQADHGNIRGNIWSIANIMDLSVLKERLKVRIRS